MIIAGWKNILHGFTLMGKGRSVKIMFFGFLRDG